MAKPPLHFTRPVRTGEVSPTPLRTAPSPEIDLESPEVHAFSLRGRVSIGSTEPNRIITSAGTPTGTRTEVEAILVDDGAVDDPWRYVAVKLPTVTGRKLAAIADLRCSKRTRVAVEVLDRPLRELAESHRTGACPPLPRVSAGTARSGVSLVLPKDLAEELQYVVETRGAVKAQILSRLIVPAIDALYIREVLNRN